MVNPIIGACRQEFYDALRSKVYIQGRQRLEYSDHNEKIVRHCCLGVGCRVAMVQGLDLKVDVINKCYKRVTSFRFDETDYDSTILPRHVAEWFGFDLSNPIILPDFMDLMVNTIPTSQQ